MGADNGIDGRLYFHDDAEIAKTKQVVFSVKPGHPTVARLPDLRGVIEREKAEIGVLLTMQEPTGPMQPGRGFISPRSIISRIHAFRFGLWPSYLKARASICPLTGDFRTFKRAPRVKGQAQAAPVLPFDLDDSE